MYFDEAMHDSILLDHVDNFYMDEDKIVVFGINGSRTEYPRPLIMFCGAVR